MANVHIYKTTGNKLRGRIISNDFFCSLKLSKFYLSPFPHKSLQVITILDWILQPPLPNKSPWLDCYPFQSNHYTALIVIFKYISYYVSAMLKTLQWLP